MKFLFIFSMLLLCVPVFSNDFSGTTWALSGVGCRDGSLSRRSHVSKAPSSDSQDVTAGMFQFLDDRNVEMTATMKGREQSQRGTYRVRGNKISVEGGRMDIIIEGDELIIRGSGHEAFEICCGERFEDVPPEEHGDRYKECKRDNPFVYILEEV